MLMRSEKSTSSELSAWPKCEMPPATIAKMALPMNRSTTPVTIMQMTGNTLRLRPLCLRAERLACMAYTSS